jgi:hypothetical protein
MLTCLLGADLSSQGKRGDGDGRGGGVVALVEHHEGHLEGKIDEGGKEQLSSG